MAQRGDVSAICYNLNQAFQEGCLEGKSRLLKILRNVSETIRRKARGHRFTEATKQLYDAVKIVGGARVARLLSHNLESPKRSTQATSRRQHTFNVAYILGF